MSTGQLVRSTNDRKVAGVAAGIADHFDIDIGTMRVLWVLAVLFGGFGFLAYVILWIVLPEGETGASASTSRSSALRIVEERYARGEIDATEFRRLKEDLA
jgi:phage shock protein PspC (stress-responsive transcriptional regulator)